MARIRTIKPEFFRHEGLYELEQETGFAIRVAFAGLWTACDREGRFWVGTMVMDMALAAPAGVLLRLDARRAVTATTTTAGPQLSPAGVDGLLVPNGLAFSPDGRTLYLSDSHPTVQTIWAFDLAPDGTPTARRVFVDMRQHAGRPDGAAIDTDGNPASSDFASVMSALTTLGRYGTPDEVGNLVAWLASEQSSYITGSVINIDGGVTA